MGMERQETLLYSCLLVFVPFLLPSESSVTPIYLFLTHLTPAMKILTENKSFWLREKLIKILFYSFKTSLPDNFYRMMIEKLKQFDRKALHYRNLTSSFRVAKGLH